MAWLLPEVVVVSSLASTLWTGRNCGFCVWRRLFVRRSLKKVGDPMNARLRSMTTGGSMLVLAGLVLAVGCAPKTRGRPYAIPVPLQLQTVVAIDPHGNQVRAGSFAGKIKIAGGELASAGGTDIFIAKASKAGAPVFPPQRFGGTGDDAATGIAVDADGSIVLAGTIQGEATFADQRLKAEVRHEGQRAVFVARMDPAGKVLWVKQIAVANAPTQVSVAVGPDHNILVGATGRGTIAKKEGQLTLVGESVMLNMLSPKGDAITPPPGSQIQLLSLPVGCGHSPCQTGGVLVPGCGPNPCTAWICSVDPYCCGVAWDWICVGEVGSVCQNRCDCSVSNLCSQGNAYYPDACQCTMQLYGVDRYCDETYWDSICVGEVGTVCGITCPP